MEATEIKEEGKRYPIREYAGLDERLKIYREKNLPQAEKLVSRKKWEMSESYKNTSLNSAVRKLETARDALRCQFKAYKEAKAFHAKLEKAYGFFNTDADKFGLNQVKKIYMAIREAQCDLYAVALQKGGAASELVKTVKAAGDAAEALLEVY